MAEREKVQVESLSSEAENLGLSMHKGDSEGLYYLAKEQSLSGESHRVGPDMSLDDIAAFLKEERAVRAALRPTCWLADVPANIDMPNESKIVSVIVEVVAKEADAPAFASEQARRFVEAKYGRVITAAETPGAVPAQKPDRNPDGALARAAFLSGLDRRIQALTYGDVIFANRPPTCGLNSNYPALGKALR